MSDRATHLTLGVVIQSTEDSAVHVTIFCFLNNYAKEMAQSELLGELFDTLCGHHLCLVIND